ncbi:hypothetical protein [Peribacillus muralis]|uniref:hypothetical protein n=1 Tax=Peribacillus muralis TaxID=264697 RepID=UPI00367227D9
MVFLKKGKTGNYFGAIEPYLIKFDENDIALLQSNLLDLNEEDLNKTEKLGEQTYTISNDIYTNITDKLSRKNIKTIKQDIKNIQEE